MPSDHAAISNNLLKLQISARTPIIQWCVPAGRPYALVSHHERHRMIRRPVKFPSMDTNAFFTAMNGVDALTNNISMMLMYLPYIYLMPCMRVR